MNKKKKKSTKINQNQLKILHELQNKFFLILQYSTYYVVRGILGNRNHVAKIKFQLKKKDDVKEKTPNNILNTSKQNTIKSFIIIHGEGN